jgi:hypothetical protein
MTLTRLETRFSDRPGFALGLALIALVLALASSSQGQPSGGTVSAAAKMVYLADDFAFPSQLQNDCGDGIPAFMASLPFRLNTPGTLSPGSMLFAPYYSTQGLFPDSFITVQNVDTEDSVVAVYYFDDLENLVACDSVVLAPGASHVFHADRSPASFGAAIVLSSTPEGTFFNQNEGEYTPCPAYLIGQHFKSGADKGALSAEGPLMTGQVELVPASSPGIPARSTAYELFSNQVGEVPSSGGDRRYVLPRARKTGAAVNTLVAVFNTDPAATLYDVSFQEEPGGAIVESATLYLTGYDLDVIDLSEIFPDTDFAGAVILEATANSGTPLAIVGTEIDLGPATTAASHQGIPLGSGSFHGAHSNVAVTPILFEPGWEMEVTLYQLDEPSTTLDIKRYDSLGSLVDAASLEIFLEQPLTYTFPNIDLGPTPEANFAAVIRAYRRDNQGRVVEAICYNAHDRAEAAGRSPFAFEDKGTSEEEEGGADVLALPFAFKGGPESGKSTEILLTNLNNLPGQTAAALFLYDQAGLRDVQCLILDPLETRRIPVDFPAFGADSPLSVVVRGIRTNQLPELSGTFYETYSLAGLAIQRSTTPEATARSVQLAPGGNDVSLAYTGRKVDSLSVGTRIHALPLLGSGTDSSGVAIDIQTISALPLADTHLGVVFFDRFGGVAGVELSDPLAFPGSDRMEGSDIPDEALSAMAFGVSINNATLLAAIESATSVARYAGFLRDYLSAPPAPFPHSFAVNVIADRPAPDGSAHRVLSAYESEGRFDLPVQDPIYSGYSYRAPHVVVDEGFDTRLVVQNMGSLNTGVEVLLVRETALKSEPSVKSLEEALEKAKGPQDKHFGGAALKTVSLGSLTPGQSREIRISEEVEPGFRGVAIIRGSQPMSVLEEVFSGGTLASFRAVPLEIVYSAGFMNSSSLIGSQAVFVPLAYLPEDGWDTDVLVQNQFGTLDAKVRVDFHGPDGKILESRTGFIPPGRNTRFHFEAWTRDPNGESEAVGWIEIASEDIFQEGNDEIPPAHIAGAVHQVRRNDTGCVLEAIGFNALGEFESFDWPGGGPVSFSDPQLLVFPSFPRELGPNLLSAEAAIVNLNPNPGTTIARTVRYIGEGFVTNLSNLTLNPGQSLLFKADEVAGLADGFGALSMLMDGGPSPQQGPFGLAGAAVIRAEGLLPHEECAGSSSHTPTATPSPTELVAPTATPSPTSTPETPPTATPTATEVGAPTATLTPDDSERNRADINRDGFINSLDQLILLKYWRDELAK